MNKKALSLLGMAFLVCTSYAQEKTQDSLVVEQLETVVLDTKFNMNREKSGKVIYKISQADLEKVKGQSLAQTINTVSGIEITGAKSVQGTNLEYRIRGGKNNQVVILIDGIQVNDPSTISSDFDMRLLDVNLIKSIEIIKGGVSTLYGSGATTAVINITTKQVTDEKATATVFMNMGSNRAINADKYKLNTATFGANVNGKINKFSYLAAASIENAKGISAAKSTDGSTFEDDPFERTAITAKIGYDFSKAFKVNAFANYGRFNNQFDNGGTTDGYNQATSENIQLGVNPEYKYRKGSISLTASYAKTDRNNKKTSYPATYLSNTLTADLYNKYKFNRSFWAVIGVNYQEQKMEQSSIPYGSSALVTDLYKNDTEITTIDPYVNATYFSDFGLTVNAGVRLNNHDNYGSHFVYNINPSFNIEATDKLDVKVLASGSTSYIAPTLYQQYSPNYGATDLDPQESLNAEAGVELTYSKKHRFSAIAFHREDKNYIDFVNLYDPISGWWIGGVYQNIADDNIKTQGVEVEASLPLCKSLNLNGNYTFTQHETNALSRRIPKHKANSSLSYVYYEKTSLTLAYQFTDMRHAAVWNPITFTTDDATLDAYSLVNFFVNHQLTESLEINASLFNAFDEEFTEVYGYSTRGRNYLLGLKLNF